MERFDRTEYVAARSMSEAEYFWRNHQRRTIATRITVPPKGIVKKIKHLFSSAFERERSL